jgi:hypothetical protein
VDDALADERLILPDDYADRCTPGHCLVRTLGGPIVHMGVLESSM